MSEEKKELEVNEKHRGIPEATFLKDVAQFVKASGKNVDDCYKDLMIDYQKYKFMEQQLVTQKRGLLAKIPDMKNALQALGFLIEKQGEETETHFKLSSNIFAKAKVEGSETVFLWLGANVMLEYPIEEAKIMLQKNLNAAEYQLNRLTTDMEFLKDQITVSEVNIARLHNHRVKLKKETKAETQK